MILVYGVTRLASASQVGIKGAPPLPGGLKISFSGIMCNGCFACTYVSVTPGVHSVQRRVSNCLNWTYRQF